jgi:hypothetical protein
MGIAERMVKNAKRHLHKPLQLPETPTMTRLMLPAILLIASGITAQTEAQKAGKEIGVGPNHEAPNLKEKRS